MERCHDLDVDQDGSVLGEILTFGGVGLMITNSNYRRVRVARISDLQMILRILDESKHEAILVKRSAEYLHRNIDRFFVFSIDEKVVGCFELQKDSHSKSAVLGGRAVALSQRNQGVGRELVQASINQARLWKLENIYALTMNQTTIFQQFGFQAVKLEELPEWKLGDLDHPTSQIFRYSLVAE